MTKKWSMNSDDVTYEGKASSGGKPGTLERKLKTTSAGYKLTHRPTGVFVEGEIPAGNYSKKEMQKLKSGLYQQLYRELEDKVAKYLKVPGR